MTGTISFDGLATGINTTETVDKLIEVMSRPKILKEAEKTRYQNEQAAWQEISKKLEALRTTEKEVWRSTTWNTLKVASTNSSVLTATTAYGAKEGTYTLSVEQLALNGQQASKSYATSTSLVGAGTLTLAVGTANAEIAVTDTDTLTSLATKINDAKIGATASLVMDGTNYRLMISADKTGVANDVTLGGDVATELGLTKVQAAQDAIVKFGTTDPAKGSTAMTYTSSYNKVEGVIENVTLNLMSASPGEAITLSTSRDSSSVLQSIQSFVDAYNEVVGYINKITGYDETDKIRGVLQSDTSALSINDRMRRTISGILNTEGDYRTLRSIGLTLEDTGELTLDSDKLSTAISKDGESVENLFRQAETGLMPKIDAYLYTLTAPLDGVADRKINHYDDVISQTEKRIEDMEELLAKRRESLMEQFVKMETAIKSFNSQSSYLTSQLAGINKNWG